MIRTAFLFALACSVAEPSMAADAVIALRPEATVSGSVFRLQDIADMGAAGAERKLAAIEIGVVPRPGHTERLSQQQVERAIEAQAPEWRGKLQIGGSKTVTVRAVGIAVERDRLVRLAKDSLQAELGGRFEKVEIKQVGEPRQLALPPAAELKARPTAGPVSRRMAVWIDIQVDGRVYAAVPIWFAVQAWKSIPVAKTDFASGTVLRPDDLVMEARDVAQAGRVLYRMPDEGGARLRQALMRGMPVPQSALEPAIAISRNQSVAVKIAAGSIVIETAGIAQDNGRVGDMVKIKNSGSNEIFLATVLEPGVVSVNAR
jgi:flagella basal body P-ring formation protein FlgA